MPLKDDEARELLELLEESELSDGERRRTRMRAAEARLWGVDGNGNPRLTGLAELISKARHNAYAYRDGRDADIQHLTRDEFIVVSFGMLPNEHREKKPIVRTVRKPETHTEDRCREPV